MARDATRRYNAFAQCSVVERDKNGHHPISTATKHNCKLYRSQPALFFDAGLAYYCYLS